MSEPAQRGRAWSALRLDLRPEHRQPSNLRVAIATVVSVGGSLAVDAILVALGTAVFPATKGYTHFRFFDYAELTVIGVVIACVAWPVVTRMCAAPRWLFLRLAVLVTLVLWLPDVWLLARNQPPKAVAVLMVMHLAIAVVTYNALVRIAPVQDLAHASPTPSSTDTEPDAVRTPAGADMVEPADDRPWTSRRSPWIVMGVSVVLEFGIGLAALFIIPTGRPSGILPDHGRLVYGIHGLLGAVLLAGAAILAVAHRRGKRFVRIGAVTGLVGILLGGIGGLLATWHPYRSLGIVLMFVGSVVAGFGYFVGAAEPAAGEDAVEPTA